MPSVQVTLPGGRKARFAGRERREQRAVRRWGQQRVGVVLRRQGQEDTDITP